MRWMYHEEKEDDEEEDEEAFISSFRRIWMADAFYPIADLWGVFFLDVPTLMHHKHRTVCVCVCVFAQKQTGIGVLACYGIWNVS